MRKRKTPQLNIWIYSTIQVNQQVYQWILICINKEWQEWVKMDNHQPQLLLITEISSNNNLQCNRDQVVQYHHTLHKEIFRWMECLQQDKEIIINLNKIWIWWDLSIRYSSNSNYYRDNNYHKANIHQPNIPLQVWIKLVKCQ